MKNWFKNLFYNRNQPKRNHEKNVFTNALPITDVLAAEREWIKIVPKGLFPIHHCGPHEVTDEHINEMEKNFKNSKTDLLFDYEHRSLWGESIAAGWSAEVEAREDGLYCKYPEFTNKATEHIEEKEYRYLSPVYKLDDLDKEGRDIGATLLSVGLTNTPYLDNEIDHIGNSVVASEEEEPETKTDTRTDMKLTKENLKKLGLSEDATEEQINEAIANSKFSDTAVETEEEETTEEKGKQPEPNAGGSQASEKENERIKALEDKIAKKEQEELAEKAEALVNSAIDQGKILPRDRGAYLNFAESDYATAKEEIGKLKANSVSPGKMQVNKDIDEDTGKKVNSIQAMADYTKAKRAATA